MLPFVRHIIILQERFSFETLPKNNILHGIVREKKFQYLLVIQNTSLKNYNWNFIKTVKTERDKEFKILVFTQNIKNHNNHPAGVFMDPNNVWSWVPIHITHQRHRRTKICLYAVGFYAKSWTICKNILQSKFFWLSL